MLKNHLFSKISEREIFPKHRGFIVNRSFFIPSFYVPIFLPIFNVFSINFLHFSSPARAFFKKNTPFFGVFYHQPRAFFIKKISGALAETLSTSPGPFFKNLVRTFIRFGTFQKVTLKNCLS